jgi:hypothetical protein
LLLVPRLQQRVMLWGQEVMLWVEEETLLEGRETLLPVRAKLLVERGMQSMMSVTLSMYPI